MLTMFRAGNFLMDKILEGAPENLPAGSEFLVFGQIADSVSTMATKMAGLSGIINGMQKDNTIVLSSTKSLMEDIDEIKKIQESQSMEISSLRMAQSSLNNFSRFGRAYELFNLVVFWQIT